MKKRQYYRPSGYESISLEPERVYRTKELAELGISQPNVSKAVDRGNYTLNPDFQWRRPQ